MKELRENELVGKLQEGDVESFHVIFDSYYKPLVTYARKFLADIEEAEDQVQKVFLYIWEKRKSLDIGVSLKSYLFRSVHNACLNHLKREDLKNEYAREFLMNLASREALFHYSLNGFNYVAEKDLSTAIEHSIESLPATCKKIFRLSRLKGLKNREIAQEMSISVRTVETQIYRALKIMRLNLKEFMASSISLFFLYNILSIQ